MTSFMDNPQIQYFWQKLNKFSSDAENKIYVYRSGLIEFASMGSLFMIFFLPSFPSHTHTHTLILNFNISGSFLFTHTHSLSLSLSLSLTLSVSKWRVSTKTDSILLLYFLAMRWRWKVGGWVRLWMSGGNIAFGSELNLVKELPLDIAHICNPPQAY